MCRPVGQLVLYCHLGRSHVTPASQVPARQLLRMKMVKLCSTEAPQGLTLRNSVDHYSFASIATDGSARIQDCKLNSRFLGCNLTNWKTCCAVLFSKFSGCTTVRLPKDGFCSIMTLLALAKRASSWDPCVARE